MIHWPILLLGLVSLGFVLRCLYLEARVDELRQRLYLLRNAALHDLLDRVGEDMQARKGKAI